jgi:hypothetical protein
VNHIVSFSGGICSWAAAKRVVEKHGTEGVVLLFADTKTEDEDLYRFIDEAAANVGVPLTVIADGRDVWQVFHDKKYLGNSKIDPCSRSLKRELVDKWVKERFDPAQTVRYNGLDWTEMHRVERHKRVMLPWRMESPMSEKPYLTKDQMIEWLRAEGIEPPRLYAMGFPHNNCGGFCIKAGIDNFRLLLHTMPDRYAYHEQKEQELREHLGKDVAILRDRTGGESKPLTLKALREREECLPMPLGNDFGGCGCMVEDSK